MKIRVIIHFQPLEFYPPVQNLLNEICRQKNPAEKLYVFTTTAACFRGNAFNPTATNVIICRNGKTGNGLNAFSRYRGYILFFANCFLQLLLKKPASILYYETLSSYPVYLYKRYVNARVPVLIHYHEYTSPGEYAQGMKLVRYFHQCEKWLYGKLSWLSHTNEFRMQQFLIDISPVKTNCTGIVPNYPPAAWADGLKQNISNPVKFVYAGAMSLENMYTAEFARWIIAQEGKATWDIFSLNITEDAKAYLTSMNTAWIRVCDGIDYKELPGVLKKYDIGLVLYKGHIPNYVINAPNKLFEYHVCGLDVWFPGLMIGSLQYVTGNTYPKITAVDFEQPGTMILEEMINRTGYTEQFIHFTCEKALAPLCRQFLDQPVSC